MNSRSVISSQIANKIGGRLVIPVGADRRGRELVRVTCVQKIITAARISRTSASFHLIGEEGATAKEGEAHALARRALRPVFPEEENAGPEPRRRSGIVPID
jgi:protein-L-isoaspartate(D-aspartate) O-methyltransferase